MKYYTVIIRLSGAPANAVAVEWTNKAAPVGSGEGWEPCVRLADGSWRFSSFDPAAAVQPHKRGPGAFAGLAFRYRLSASDPWSAASASRKEIVIVARDGEDVEVAPPAPVAPFVAFAPALAGLGKIGTEVTVAPGLWGGDPAPQLGFQWRRNGTAIPGAVARAYVPVAADDLANLDVAVTARNAAGESVAVTAALRVTYPAPTAVGTLPEEVFDEGPGSELVETAQAFAGANLTFTTSGAGVTIDPRTGVLSVSTETPVSGRTVTVAAANSGGEARVTLRFTVEAAPVVIPAPKTLGPADLTVLRSVWRPAGTQSTYFTPVVAFPGLAGQTVDAIEWTTTTGDVPEAHWEIVVARPGEAGAYDLWMRTPASRNPTAVPKVDYAVFDATEAQRRTWLRFRWRATPTGAWSAPSSFAEAPVPAVVDTPAPTPTPVPGGANLWRPMPMRPQLAFGAAKVDRPDYYTKGEYGGFGPQMCHAGWREGDDVFLYGDMHGIRRSRDGGRTWHYLNAWGHAGWGASAIARDPVDPNRIIAMGGRVWETSTAVLTTSVDGGNTFPHVTNVPNGTNYNHRVKTNQICYWPVSGGSSATRKWRVTAWHENGGGTSGDVTLLTSTNGGVSWTSAIIAGWSGRRVHRLLQSPHAEGTLYAATNTGLLVSTNNGVSWTSLATGDWRDVWEDPAAAGRLIAARHADGIWHRPAGAATSTSFALVLNRTRIVSMAVGGLFAGGARRRIFASRAEWVDNWSDRRMYCQEWVLSAAPLASVSDNYTTSGWFRGNTIPYDPSDGSEHTRMAAGDGFHGFYPSQTNDQECCLEGFGVPWITTDGGRNWRMSGTGYNGENWQALAFDPWDPAWIGAGLADVYCLESANAGDFFTRQGYNGNALISAAGIAQSWSCGGIARIPYRPEVPANKQGRRISLAGNNHGNCLLLRRDANATSWTQIAGPAYRNTIEISRTNGNKVYVYNLRSTDAGDSFVSMAYAIVGASPQNGDNIVGHNGSGAYARSTDGGANWTAWFSTGVSCNIGTGIRACISPHDWNMCIVPGSGEDVVLRNGSDQRTLNLRGAFEAVGGPVPSYWTISGLGWCPRDPRVIYATGRAPGGPAVWRGVFNAGYTAVTWTDITTNYPRTVQPSYMKIHPVTGDVFVGKGGGIHALPAPGALHPSSIWANLPKPLPNGATY